MKRLYTFFTICIFAGLSQTSLAKEKKTEDKRSSRSVIWIDSDEDDRSTDVSELRHKVSRLEKAVRQLQDRVFELEADSKPDEKEEVTCILETTFGNILTATAKTESKARMDVYLQCRKENQIASICKKEKIQCKV